MPEVLDIESRLNPYPWEEDDFIRHLRQRNTIGMVAEKHDEVIGFWFATEFLQGWYDDSGEDGYVMEHWFEDQET